jgi:HEAT repeat protein
MIPRGRTMNLSAALRDVEDRDARVRAQAADALGRVDEGRDAAIAALLRAANDDHPSVRYAALLSLGELGAPSAVDVLVAHLTDAESLCREAAAIALGQIHEASGPSPAAWNALVTALGAPEPEVRFQAIASLAELDAARAAASVAPLLDDGDGKVRAQAAAALGDAGDATYVAGYVDRLARLLDDTDDVRHEAALALARLHDRRAVAPLVAALKNSARALDAATALAALDAARDEGVRDALAGEMTRLFGDALVKVRAAEALAKAGDARGVEHLRKAASSRREEVRGLAQSVLSSLGHGD